MLGLSTSYSMAMILVVIGALGIGAFHPEGAGLAGKQSGDKHGTGMGIFSTGGAAGVSIGAVLVTALVSAWGLHATIYGAVIGISIAVLMWRKVRHVHFDHAKTTNNGLSRRGSFLVLGVVAWMAVIRAFVMTAFHALLPTWYADQGASLYYIGVLIGAFTFFGGMGSLLGGILADKFGEKHILWSSFVLPVPLLVLFVMMNGTGGLVLISLGGMTLMLSISSVVAIAQRTFPKNVNTASSVVMGLSWGLGALLVIPTGALAETYGIYPVLLGITLTPLLAAMSAPLLSGRLPDRVGQTIELEEEVSYGAGPTIL